MKKPLIITIITVIVLALSGCAFWYLNAQKQEVINENESVIQNKGEKDAKEKEQEEDNWDNAEIWPEEEFAEADYEGWKEYVNEEFEYSLKYPADWIFEDSSDRSISHTIQIYPKDYELFIAYFGIGRDYKESSLEQYANALAQNSKKTKIKFNNRKAYQFTNYNSESNYYDILVADDNGTVYTITTYKYNLLEVRQIFASFKFTNN